MSASSKSPGLSEKDIVYNTLHHLFKSSAQSKCIDVFIHNFSTTKTIFVKVEDIAKHVNIEANVKKINIMVGKLNETIKDTDYYINTYTEIVNNHTTTGYRLIHKPSQPDTAPTTPTADTAVHSELPPIDTTSPSKVSDEATIVTAAVEEAAEAVDTNDAEPSTPSLEAATDTSNDPDYDFTNDNDNDIGQETMPPTQHQYQKIVKFTPHENGVHAPTDDADAEGDVTDADNDDDNSSEMDNTGDEKSEFEHCNNPQLHYRVWCEMRLHLTNEHGSFYKVIKALCINYDLELTSSDVNKFIDGNTKNKHSVSKKVDQARRLFAKVGCKYTVSIRVDTEEGKKYYSIDEADKVNDIQEEVYSPATTSNVTKRKRERTTKAPAASRASKRAKAPTLDTTDEISIVFDDTEFTYEKYQLATEYINAYVNSLRNKKKNVLAIISKLVEDD